MCSTITELWYAYIIINNSLLMAKEKNLTILKRWYNIPIKQGWHCWFQGLFFYIERVNKATNNIQISFEFFYFGNTYWFDFILIYILIFRLPFESIYFILFKKSRFLSIVNKEKHYLLKSLSFYPKLRTSVSVISRKKPWKYFLFCFVREFECLY